MVQKRSKIFRKLQEPVQEINVKNSIRRGNAVHLI